MTKIECETVLLKRDTTVLTELLRGGVSLGELMKALPLYSVKGFHDLMPNDRDFEMDSPTDMEGLMGLVVTIYLQTEGDCIFVLSDANDGTGAGMLDILLNPFEAT